MFRDAFPEPGEAATGGGYDHDDARVGTPAPLSATPSYGFCGAALCGWEVERQPSV